MKLLLPYTTPTGLPTYDLVTQHLQIHAQTAVQGPGIRAPSNAAKVGKFTPTLLDS